VADDNGMVWVDCKKTRTVEAEWGRSGKPLKALAPANRLQSITGKTTGGRVDFARVRRSTLQKFSEACGRPAEYFHADPDELDRWRKQQANQLGASNGGGVATSDARVLEQLYKRLCGFYELYHHATSKREAPKVSVSLLHVDGFDPTRSVIQCELHDKTQTRPYFHFVGHITEIVGFLEWSLGPAHELVLCRGYSYLPVGEKYPDFTLYGIFLSLSQETAN
jgi:hypothetical protein